MVSHPEKPPDARLLGCEVVVCVSGGISAYKTCEVVSRLVQRGAGVTVAMTEAAQKFVGPTTFRALTTRNVLTGLWSADEAHDVQHISATDRADVMLVAPATANVIGKIAAGIADDIVTTLVISAASPVVLAPAMNPRMWESAVVRRNVATLKERGFVIVGPGEGWLACRSIGAGRMAEPDEVVAEITSLLKDRPSAA